MSVNEYSPAAVTVVLTSNSTHWPSGALRVAPSEPPVVPGLLFQVMLVSDHVAELVRNSAPLVALASVTNSRTFALDGVAGRVGTENRKNGWTVIAVLPLTVTEPWRVVAVPKFVTIWSERT